MTTTTRRPERTRDRLGRTEIEIREDPGGGRVRVLTRSSGSGPRIRAVITGSDRTSAAVSLVPDGALLLGGDEIEIVIDVGPGTALVLTEPGGTVAYPSTRRARWDVEITVAAEASLVWHAQPFIAAQGSSTDRELRVDLAESGRLLLRETLVLGRHGEAPGAIETRTTITCAGSPVLREDLRLGSCTGWAGLLGDNRVVGSVIALGTEVPSDACPEGRMDLAGDGTLWRRLSTETHSGELADVWQAVVNAP